MKNTLSLLLLRRFAMASGVAVMAALSAQAVPYASGITNETSTSTWWFVLNESADEVKVVYDGGGAGKTNVLGELNKGSYSFSMAGHTSFQIHVTRSTPVSWTQISDDLNPLVRFYQPKGIAVWNNPADLARFGRIYVLNSTGGGTTAAPAGSNRTVQKGFYALNADQSDAFGYGASAQTAGITFASSANSPFKIELGEDGLLYISDYSTANATIFRCNPEFINGEQVLDGIGASAMPTIHTDIQGSTIAKGSIAGGNLVLWAIDGMWAGTGGANCLLRWDVNGGPLPHSLPPTPLGTAGNSASPDVQTDLDIAPDGKFYVGQNRAASPTPGYQVGRVNLRVYDTDGTSLLWDSMRISVDLGNTTDYLNNLRALKVSPDGKKLAVIRDDTQVWILPIVNGLPDLTNRFLLNAFGATSTGVSNGREVSWDRAGNLYAGNLVHEKVRVWSPGGSYTAVTASDGTFAMSQPATLVSVARSPASISEDQSSTFTFTRSGELSSTLTVNYAMSGTATNGVDYATLSGSVVFAANASTATVTLTPTDDVVAEFSETAVLTITGDPSYGITTGVATVTITDNEPTEISVTPVQGTLLEFAGAKATFQLTRKGLLGAATVNLDYSAGAAAVGVDFTGPATVAFGANTVNSNVVLQVSPDLAIEGNEAILVAVGAGAYTIGTPASATGTLVDDELPAGTLLFSESFDVPESSANWIVMYADGQADSSAEFGYDYTLDGVPEAPNTTSGAATRGLKFRVNKTQQTLSGAINASPANKTFTGDYRLRFDVWMNYNGPLADGGSGSSENLNAGIGESANGIIYAVGSSGNGSGEYTIVPPADVVMFSNPGDGGFWDNATGVADFTAFLNSIAQMPASGVYLAGTDAEARGNGNPYYAAWTGGAAAPASQVTAYPTVQTGTTSAGTIGFRWHTVAIVKQGTTVSWSIDGRPVANVSIEGINVANNVFVGYNDQYSSGTPTGRDLCFAVIDNVRVETLSVPGAPVITGIQLINGGTQVKITFTAGGSDLPGAFGVVGTTTLGGSFNTVSANITSPSSGQFEAVTAVGAGSQFYKVRRN